MSVRNEKDRKGFEAWAKEDFWMASEGKIKRYYQYKKMQEARKIRQSHKTVGDCMSEILTTISPLLSDGERQALNNIKSNYNRG